MLLEVELNARNTKFTVSKDGWVPDRIPVPVQFSDDGPDIRAYVPSFKLDIWYSKNSRAATSGSTMGDDHSGRTATCCVKVLVEYTALLVRLNALTVS
jgi:hypothetical protein